MDVVDTRTPRTPRMRRFTQLDVFGRTPLAGNPLAVVHDADGLSDAEMAAFARWTNLSETTFLLRPQDPQADYRVRIFTPGGELPFAGHPTLGSCRAWLHAGGVPRTPGTVVQACGVGLVRVRVDGGTAAAEAAPARLAFAAPPLRRTGPMAEAEVARLAAALGVARAAVVRHQWVDNGPGWCALMLGSAAEVLALAPDFGRLGDVALGVVGPHADGADAAFEVRAFVPGKGVREDPVTGSLNAALAQWLIGAGLAPAVYVAAQGAALGCAGRVHLARDGGDDGTVWVGGDTAVLIDGNVRL